MLLHNIDIITIISLSIIVIIIILILFYTKNYKIKIIRKFRHLYIDEIPLINKNISTYIPERNNKKFSEIEEMKYNIIKNINIYTIHDINNIINKIINIYIENECDFIEDYKSITLYNHYYLIQKTNTKYYKKIKKNIIINDIINRLNYINKLYTIKKLYSDELINKLNEVLEYDKLINNMKII
jgi:hypothetical protein